MTSARPDEVAAAPEDQSAERAGRDRPHWGWIAGFAVLVIGFAAIAADEVFHFDDSALDGPFQLFNGLRRIADGQRLGGTFQVFHGPGVPYLHFIPFWLFGGDFLASELSRQLVSILAAVIVLVAFFRAWTGSWRVGLPLSVVALSTLIPLRVNALLFPINSMIGLRSTMPIVIGIHLLLRPAGWRASLERAALFALALAFGIEQGMAAIGGYILLQVLIAIRTRRAQEPLRGLATVAAGIAFYALLVFIMSPSGFASVMRFNFREVPADQMWYFGGPPNAFFFSWWQLFTIFEHPVWSALIIAALVYAVRRYWKGFAAPDSAARVAEAFLTVYAVVSTASMLGTFNTVYQQPAVRIGLFIGLIAIRRWWLARRDTLKISDQLRRRAPAYASFALVGYAVAGWPLATIAVVRTPLHIAYAHGYLGDGPVLSREWQFTERIGDAVVADQVARNGRKPVLWSTYASYLEYKHDLFHPSFDYIIHALGPRNHEEYARRFVEVKPDIVQTLAPTYTGYEEWLSAHHWNFYRPLLRDYSMVAVGPWSYFWTRSPAPFDEQPTVIVHTPVPAGTLAIAVDGTSVPRDSIGLFEFRLFYHVGNPWKPLPVLGTLPRYLVHLDGTANHIPVSLAPYETEKRFPVVTVGPQTIRMLGQTASVLPGVSLTIDSIHVERIRLSPANRRWAYDFVVGPPVDSTRLAMEAAIRRR
ncbi:MAG TPA: hypothetical protein VFO55_08465 [Gemmatimonadaceae bacterium]|nr:hypothetical protein [Gemmatimonadaceae bacterium]